MMRCTRSDPMSCNTDQPGSWDIWLELSGVLWRGVRPFALSRLAIGLTITVAGTVCSRILRMPEDFRVKVSLLLCSNRSFGRGVSKIGALLLIIPGSFNLVGITMYCHTNVCGDEDGLLLIDNTFIVRTPNTVTFAPFQALPYAPSTNTSNA